ncbi:MAG: hypothetical protein ACI9WU_005249, partial [Myxococcota bacterium]
MSARLFVILCLLGGCSATTSPTQQGGSETDEPAPIGPIQDPDPVAPDQPDDPDEPDPPVDPGPGEGCLTDLEYFAAEVWAPILQVRCLSCHATGGLAGGSSLVLIPWDEPGALLHDFDVLKALAFEDVGGVPLLLAKPTNSHPAGHTGGEQVVVDSPAHIALQTMIARWRGELGPDGCDAPPEIPEPECDGAIVGPQLVRRLTRYELQQTMLDLIGVDVDTDTLLTAEPVVGGFDNHADSLTVGPLFAEQWRGVVEELGETLSLDGLIECSSEDELCPASFVASFGRRAFRRPLSDEDVVRYLSLFDLAASVDGFDAGARLVLTAMLQSPHFLYRFELGQDLGNGLARLGPYEVASELSYLLWASMPDDVLLDAAESGELASDAGIAAQAQRLLESPRSAAALARFTRQWLDIDRLETIDKAAFPQLTPSIRAAMAGEAERLVANAVAESWPLTELIASDTTWLTAELAWYYGLPAPTETDADGYGPVSLAGSPRSGLLTLGAVLTKHAFADSSSPVHRGKLIRERLLCGELPSPPAGILVNVPPLDDQLTTRQRFAAHSENQPCNGCHELMDPIGFALEGFDGAGQHRTLENGQPIDTSGEIVATTATDGTFEGAAGLSAALSTSDDVARCMANQWLRNGYGFDPVEAVQDGACLEDALLDDVFAHDMHVSALAIGLTRRQHFRERSLDPSLGDTVDAWPDPPAFEPPVVVVGPPGDKEGQGSVLQTPTSGVEVDVVITSQWAEGYCADIVVTNTSDSPVTWLVHIPIDGQLSTVWNAVAEQNGGVLQLQGVQWNASLNPGATATAGLCASGPVPESGDPGDTPDPDPGEPEAFSSDGFETGTAGQAPDAAIWAVEMPDCSGQGSVTVDDQVAHSGGRSLRVGGAAGYCNHIFVAPAGAIPTGPVLHGRYYVRFDQALANDHVTFVTLPDSAGSDLRMGGQGGILMWNRESDDATLPELSPTGIGKSLAPSAQTWTCVEWSINRESGAISTAVDGALVEGLVVDDVATPDVDGQWHNGFTVPDPAAVLFGWESYGGASMTLWFDDI